MNEQGLGLASPGVEEELALSSQQGFGLASPGDCEELATALSSHQGFGLASPDDMIVDPRGACQELDRVDDKIEVAADVGNQLDSSSQLPVEPAIVAVGIETHLIYSPSDEMGSSGDSGGSWLTVAQAAPQHQP